MIPARVRPPVVGPEVRDPVQRSVLAHQPELLRAFTRLYGTLWSRGVVDQPTKELARIRNARLVDCPICKAIRFAGPRAQGLGEDTLELVRDGYEASALSPKHKAVLRYVDAFLSDPHALASSDRDALRRHFTDAQIVELTAAIALFMGFSKIAVSLGGLPDEIPVHEQPTPDC